MAEVGGLPETFLEDMHFEDSDWLILIKCHALLETCVNRMLALHFGIPEASNAFTRLEMSNPKTGKMAFVSACNLLPKNARVFIQKLSEMRNFAVHDIKNLDFTFRSYMDAIDIKDRPAWQRAMVLSIGKQREIHIEDDPKLVVVVGVKIILTTIFLQCARDALKKPVQGDSDFEI